MMLQDIKNQLASTILMLAAHPDNTECTEFADRIEALEETVKAINHGVRVPLTSDMLADVWEQLNKEHIIEDCFRIDQFGQVFADTDTFDRTDLIEGLEIPIKTPAKT